MEIKIFQNCWQKQVEKILTQDFFDEFKIPTTKRSSDIFNVADFYQKTGGNFWVLENNGEILGTIGLKKFDEKVGILKRFFVNKNLRRKGFGSKLLQKTLNFAQEKKFEKIFLSTIEELNTAIKFYEKHNFQRLEKWPEFLGSSGIDNVFFVKDLK